MRHVLHILLAMLCGSNCVPNTGPVTKQRVGSSSDSWLPSRILDICFARLANVPLGFQLSFCLILFSGFMTLEERKLFENLKSPHLKYWIPAVWFTNLASRARKEGRIKDSVDLQTILSVSPHSLPLMPCWLMTPF